MISKTKIFLLIFIPAALALAFGMALVQDKNKTISVLQFEKMMESQWQLVSLMLESPEIMEKLQELSQDSQLRVTVIDPDGHVMLDSATTGPFEPHHQREEVRSALSGHPLFITRESRSTNDAYIYFAKKLSDGRVLRLSYPAQYYQQQQTALFNQTAFGLAVLCAGVLAFAALISGLMSHAMTTLSLAVKEAQSGGSQLPCFNNPPLDSALYCLSKSNRELKQAHQENLKISQRISYVLENINEGILLLEGDNIVYYNKKAEEILNYKLPNDIREINQVAIIGLFEKFRQRQSMDMEEIYLGSKILAVNLSSSEARKLIILHDISDKEKYSGYKSNLIGNISHELKTPLTIIMGAAETIVKDRQIPKEYLDKFLNTIYKNAERVNNILDDLISLHQLESAKNVEAGECDIQELLVEVKDLIAHGDKKIIYKADEGLVKIHSAHMMSVLTNLINNAVKYSNGPEILVDIKHKSNIVEIKVADQGPLIPAEERSRIFERFYSISQSRHRDKSGSGLGLSIVKHIARLYCGQVELKENEFGGNTFIVQLVEK